jgi:hypothetical protein
MPIDWSLTLRVFQTVGLYTLGFTIYATIIYFFYKRGSKRLLLTHTPSKATGLRAFFANAWYAVEYLFLSPLILFLWGCIIATIVFLLAKNFAAEQALLAAMALLATIRVTAYFSEELSADVAKLVPLSLLAIVAFDAAAIDLAAFWTKVQTLPLLLVPSLAAFAFIVILELILRIGYALVERD